MNKKLVLALMGMTAAGIASAATVYMQDIGLFTDGNDIHHLQKDYTMVASNEYVLDGRLVVDPGYILTIEPGTVIRSTPHLTDPGALFIDRGAKIYANGTAENPIIFTNMGDSNVPGMTPVAPYDQINTVVADWGGVVISGKAFLNKNNEGSDINYDTLPVEGVPANANLIGGGNNDDDSSGVFKYVSIRYNGFRLSDGDELNGLSLYGVGRGTEIHHVESFNSQDDGIEFFGGTVNSKYMTIWSAGDDSFDLDNGHRGKHQFVFVVQGSCDGAIGAGVSDKGMEIDGSSDDWAQPFGMFRIYNATLIGKGEDNAMASSIGNNTALNIRDNGSPQIFNSVFMDFGGAGATIEWRDDKENSYGHNDSFTRFSTGNELALLPSSTATNYLGQTIGAADFYQAQEPGNQGMIADCVFWKFGDDVRPTIAGGYDLASFNDTFDLSCIGSGDNFDFLAAEFNNTVDQSGTGAMPIVSLTRGPYIGQSGEEVAVPTNINPRAAGDALTTSRVPEADGFFSPVNYKGAFSPTHNWAKGWTLMDSLGVFAGQDANPSAPSSTIELTASTFWQSVNGVVYTVEESGDMDAWTPITSVTGDGSIMAATDLDEFDSAKFYRVVPQ
jgi:hypothetical protein